ncbi:MAG: hypothetical protein C4527_21370 [Candidatus Omnitrophota bacterium]|jgi:hypothetical protein|nr:MAG: hypothetical protein C4527_21370 [Candidatus Omnitrophota bacterium]
MNVKAVIFLSFSLFIGFVLAADLPAAESSNSQQLEAKLMADRVIVTIDGSLFTEYRFRDEQKYPYFYPVNGPRSGKSVTTETSEPYPHHHSLFFGCDRVNGGNYWQDGVDRGRIISKKVRFIKPKGEKVIFDNECLWERPDAESPFRDVRRIDISAPSADLRLIDFEIELEALIDVTIEKNNHSLFSARMVPELSVQGGGTLINSEGDKSEAGTFGKPARWCDYWGTRDGVTEGLAIFDDPENRWHPSRWFTRDYGFFSPTPMYWLENDRLVMKKGEKLRLRYQAAVHGGNTEEAGIAKISQQ